MSVNWNTGSSIFPSVIETFNLKRNDVIFSVTACGNNKDTLILFPLAASFPVQSVSAAFTNDNGRAVIRRADRSM